MILPRLTDVSMPALPTAFKRPGYVRAPLIPGIVHFGPGAFFRAHQASYFDHILSHDPRWGVSAVALNSDAVAMALQPQDGLYTLALLGETTQLRVIGSVLELATRRDSARTLNRLVKRTTRLVTATVTEKGYCLASDGTLDFQHPVIRADLASPKQPRSFIGWLVHGLAARRAAGVGGLTVLSCDNLSANGVRLGAAVHALASELDADLARWIADEVQFPSSMVDSITPATDEALRERVRAAGVEDAWPIQREVFTQWVVEDAFTGERPPLESAGVIFTNSIDGWEDTKLRLLNGAHSTLAYLGLLLGMNTVREAVNDPVLGGFVERLMREDIAPTLSDRHRIDAQGYIDTVLKRFREPAIRHMLAQIAWDGSQKLPVRVFATIKAARAAGRSTARLALPVAAWLRFVSLPRPPVPDIVDPLAGTLRGMAGNLEALVEQSGVFPHEMITDATFRATLREAWAAFDDPVRIRGALV